MAADGSVLTPIDTTALESIAAHFREANIESVAVAFLNSYVNPAHEAAAANDLRQLLAPIPVSESAALVPERGEFERTSTCVLNAYLTPVMAAYLGTLQDALKSQNVDAPVNIMGSNGGVFTACSGMGGRASAQAAGRRFSAV